MARRMSRQMREALQELESRGARIIKAPESLNELRMILRDLGPQKVGGHYVGGYSRQAYTVLGIIVDGYRWWIRISLGEVTVIHSTAWDYRRDRVRGTTHQQEAATMTRINCYACDGDYTAGYWLDVDGEELFYCTSCAVEHGVHKSKHARPEGEVTIWQAWLHDMLMGEGATAEDATEAAVTEYEKTGGYGIDPHLFLSREALMEALDVSLKD